LCLGVFVVVHFHQAKWIIAMIEIDGSYGEGGGQVLRTALTLSALTGQPTHIRRIRAGRRSPGLAPQHLTGVLALARICAAEVHQAAIGSTEIVFEPHTAPYAGTYVFDVAQAAQSGSAGAVSLILQTLLLPLALAEGTSHVTLKGGTHVPWSPPFEYLAHVYLPTAARMGLKAKCRLEGWGFYPVGGGQVAAEIEGSSSAALTPLALVERGRLKRIWGLATACNLPAHIAQRMADRARNMLGQAGLPAQITPRRESGVGPGAALCLVAEYEGGLAGFSALGAKGKPSEQVADEACQELKAFHASNAPVDAHLADQLLLPMALAAGRSEFRTQRVTRHLLTNAAIIRQFIPARIEVGGQEGEPGEVVVEGVGR
jgi:RNA 3'-terminal phosphate cyclase (ATP)